MRRITILWSAGVVLLSSSSWVAINAAPLERTNVQSFDVSRGQALIIQNDYGRVRVESWEAPHVEVRTRIIAPSEAQLDEVSVVAQKSGDKLFVHAYFFNYISESVYIDIRTPAFMNLVVWGANPAVELFGVEGYARVNTLSGLITAEDLMGATSLFSEKGNILYHFSRQPFSDVRLESMSGDIQLRARGGIEFRSLLKAGGALAWGEELELPRGSLEKQVGDGGPLIYASSDGGAVRFQFDTHIQSQLSVAQSHRREDLRQQPDAAILRQQGESAPAQPGLTRDEPAAGVPGTESDTGKPDSTGSLYSDSEPVFTSQTGASAAPNNPDRSVPAAGGYTFRVNVNWVYLNASVRNSYNNRAVGDLRQEDFEVFEDGVHQNVEKFESTEAPFHLLLLLDVSGSTRSFISLIREASIEFTRQIKPNDRIALAVFNSRSRLIQDFTNDRQEMARAIDRIRSGGGTAFYNALHDSITDYMRGIEGRKAIVVFSDGVDNQLTGDYSNGSQIEFRDLFREIQELDTLIYTVFLDTAQEYGGTVRRGFGGGFGGILADILRGRTRPVYTGGADVSAVYAEARDQMSSIAEQTGGRFYSPRQIQDLSRVYREIAEDLRLQYTLGYKSANLREDGKWRRIEVNIRNRSDLIVHSRKGYYAGRQ